MSPQLQILVPYLPGCSPIPGHWEEMEQEGPIEKYLISTSRNPWRSPVAHVTRIPQFTLQNPGSPTDSPKLHQFSPLVSLYECPDQMLPSSQKSPLRISPYCLLMLLPSLLPSPSSLQLSHITLMPSPKAYTSPSVLAMWPPPSAWILQEREHRTPPSG